MTEETGRTSGLSVHFEGAELDKLMSLARDRETTVEDLVREGVERVLWRGTGKHTTANLPGEMTFIAFDGLPHEDNDLRELERWAARRCEKTKRPVGIMSVPKTSLAIALAAQYHGVVIHAMDKVEDPRNEEEDF